MKDNQKAVSFSLKGIKKSLDAHQQLTTDMQCDIKGGCSNCQDLRRPPILGGSMGISVLISRQSSGQNEQG